MQTYETDVLIIGGGVTGTGILRDLALRGVESILIEKKDLCSGASGGNHGLLHSGARYVSNDLHSARECRSEGDILKKIAPHCIEQTGGLFVSVEEDDQDFGSSFEKLCGLAGINVLEIPTTEARDLEPLLSPRITRAFAVPDATIDPFHLALDNVSDAITRGKGKYLPSCEILSFDIRDGSIVRANCFDHREKKSCTVVARQYVNAGGGWAMKIAELAGCTDVRLLWSKGTLLVSHDRLTSRVINRLRPPSDGDILVPGGTVSVLGTTSVRTDTIDSVRPTVAEVNQNISQGAAMIPSLPHTRFIRAFSRVRPLVQSADSSNDRDVARSFSLFDHASALSNFCTITGGKLTTYRLMAEKTADLVTSRLGLAVPCTTHETELPNSKSCRWTEPGASPRYWYSAKKPDDIILCECEMVPQSAIDQIINESPGGSRTMSLEGIALRSRAGKGPCQGSFCGIRLGSYLYDKEFYTDKKGLRHMRDFFNERFKGMRTIIWGQQMAQMELAEALHCGLLGLENLEKEEQ